MQLEQIPSRYEGFRKEYPDLCLCRVASQEKGLYRLIGPEGEWQARVSGKFQYEVRTVSDYPAAGDYVMAALSGDGAAVIQAVLPRKSVFLRK
ncbi:MAG: ribosome small subunit-dependent GTPase, partial [Oscillibacter sp.]|nr:ribosome small subunit-dependent GTPase [Oscillibacter sp.]